MSRSAKENAQVAPAGTEPQAQLPVRGLTSLGGWASTREGFVSETAFLFEPRGLTLSGRQMTGLSCHPRLVERLRPIDSLSDQREKRGKGLAATAVSPPCALSQGHGHLAPPPCQGLPPRAQGLQVETGGGPLRSPRALKGEAPAGRRRNGAGSQWAAEAHAGEKSSPFSKAAEPWAPLREPRPGGRRGPQEQDWEGQGLREMPRHPGAQLALGAQRSLCGWRRV